MKRTLTLLRLAAPIFVAALLPLPPVSAATNSTDHAILVHTDGSVVVPFHPGHPAPGATNASVRLTFGLPQSVPVRRWLEDGTLPICRSSCEKDGIRYTETAFITRRVPGEWNSPNPPAAEAVLMVQIFGENFTNEYAGAGAHFAVGRDGAPRPLELRNDLVFSSRGASNDFVAVIEIPASGIVNTNGLRLDFHGNMPPGNTGAMVVKLPLRPSSREDEIEQLRDLQFDHELQRVKRHWEKHGRAPVPVRFSP